MRRLWRGMAVAAVAFVSAAGLASGPAAAGMAACKQTAKQAFRSCKLGAQSDTKLALGKCANLVDPAARKPCNQQGMGRPCA